MFQEAYKIVHQNKAQLEDDWETYDPLHDQDNGKSS